MSIADYQPNFYDGVVEFKLLADIEDELFEVLEKELKIAHANNFVLTANEKAIRIYEDVLNIVANPSVESIDFRRERILNRYQTKPPFTLPFLKERLDAIIGEGRYTLTVDYNNYTLYLELAFEDSFWFKEATRTINSIKPANIKYVMMPVLIERLVLKESASVQKLKRFRLNISRIGKDKLAIVEEEKEVVLS